MKIKFIGAIKSVTGSCTHVTFNVEGRERRAIIDCGMYQGNEGVEKSNFNPFPFDPAELDYLFLTHVHIDHSGLIPKLTKQGFKGRIISTSATRDLAEVMLLDSARIQQGETEKYNRKRLRMGKPPRDPLYTEEDARRSLDFFQTVSYNEEFRAWPGVNVTYHDAGHVLGSAFLRFRVNEGGGDYTVIFSGDLGNAPVPILKDPEKIGKADYVVIESTYGDRVRESDSERSSQLADVVQKTVSLGGKVIIPSFAVGRTQELIYEIHQMRDAGRIMDIPVYVDSPMACSATEIFRKHIECFDEEMSAYLRSADDPFAFPNLFYAREAEESRAINANNDPQIIISSSGMANNGRILHHLKYNIFKPECTVLFVGYQGAGTLGRQLADGAKIVNIMGEKFSVNAKIEAIHGYSAHADQAGLLKWLATADAAPRNVFIMHGEDAAKKTLQGKISESGLSSIVPDTFDEFEITGPQSFRQSVDGRAAKPAGWEEPDRRGAVAAQPAEPLRRVAVPAAEKPAAAPQPDNLENLSKKDIVRTLKEFRSQLQSMESRIDNLISRFRR